MLAPRATGAGNNGKAEDNSACSAPTLRSYSHLSCARSQHQVHPQSSGNDAGQHPEGRQFDSRRAQRRSPHADGAWKPQWGGAKDTVSALQRPCAATADDPIRESSTRPHP